MKLPYDSISEFYIKKILEIIYNCSGSNIIMIRSEEGYLQEILIEVEGDKEIHMFYVYPSPDSTKVILTKTLDKANKLNANLDQVLKDYYRRQ